MAERVIKYYEDQRAKHSQVAEKLRFRIATLKSALAKAEATKRQKEEVGDVLHYIDFHQLQIENKQYLAKIEEKNAELLRLKLTTGLTVQTLNSLKARLVQHSKEISRLRGEIRTRSQLLARLRSDTAAVSGQVTASHAAEASLARVTQDLEDMPTTLDYIGLKAAQTQLAAQVASWRRKVEIASMRAGMPIHSLAQTDATSESLAPMGQLPGQTTSTGIPGHREGRGSGAPSSVTASATAFFAQPHRPRQSLGQAARAPAPVPGTRMQRGVAGFSPTTGTAASSFGVSTGGRGALPGKLVLGSSLSQFQAAQGAGMRLGRR